jgi:transcriptional regulator with XRE-family HTH domain
MFYEDLKKQRETQGITLEQIAKATRINIKFLTAFEAGDFSILPYVYVRLFLRAYCQETGAIPEDILHALEDYLGIQESRMDKEIKHEEVSDSKSTKIPLAKFRPSKNLHLSAVIITLLIILFLVVILKLIFSGAERKPISAIPVGSNESSLNSTQLDSSSNMIPAMETRSDTTRVLQPLNLVMQTVDTCWIRLIIDDSDTADAIFRPNARREWIAQEKFDLRLGRPAAVSLTLNGNLITPIAFNTIPGRLIITRNGIMSY